MVVCVPSISNNTVPRALSTSICFLIIDNVVLLEDLVDFSHATSRTCLWRFELPPSDERRGFIFEPALPKAMVPTKKLTTGSDELEPPWEYVLHGTHRQFVNRCSACKNESVLDDCTI